VDPFLIIRGVTKKYPGVLALDGVDFDLRAGEIHVLLGENGAGKSTLVKILSGVVRPDEGEVLIDGAPLRLDPPSVARNLGISTVYQELALVPDMTVMQNIFMGREVTRGRAGLLDTATMRAETHRLLKLLDIDLDPDMPVRRLSLATRQVIEIVRALAWKSRALIMDEPTSSLSEHETEELFARIARLKAEGVGIIYISHRLEEMDRIADRITVMRDGRVVTTHDRGAVSRGELVRLMVGRELTEAFPKRVPTPGSEFLRVEHLTVPGRLVDVNFAVRAGEVLAIAGLVGAGRTETLRALVGLEPGAGGSVFVRGRPVRLTTPREAIREGIGLVPEDRHVQGLVLDMTVQQNIALASLPSCTNRGFLSFTRLAELARRYIARLRIKVASPAVRVATLSGGNQQKVVLARALAAGSNIVLLDEPTRGIDVGAKVEIYDLVNELAAEGNAVVLVSSELPEILGLADRIVVMREGRVSATMNRAEATQEAILAAALPVAEPAA
jgi:ribose transport system ATP-binding protein